MRAIVLKEYVNKTGSMTVEYRVSFIRMNS